MQTKLNTKDLQIKEFKYPMNIKIILDQTLYFIKEQTLHLGLSHSSLCTVFKNVKRAYIYNLIDDDTAVLVSNKLYYVYLNQKLRHGCRYGFDMINLLDETRQIKKEIESIERCIKTNQTLIKKTANKKDSKEYIKKCQKNILCLIIKRNMLIDEFNSKKRELKI